jgi:3'-5' exoribonuclease
LSPRIKKQFVGDLRRGTAVNDLFAVGKKFGLRQFSRDGRPVMHFDAFVSDITGVIAMKYWGSGNNEATTKVYNSFEEKQVIEIKRGIVGEYKGRLQIAITEGVGELVVCDDYSRSDFVRALSSEEIEKLFSKLKSEIASLKNSELQTLLQNLFGDPGFAEAYKSSPSASVLHHNYVGGNLQHSMNVLELCMTMYRLYPEIRRDLLVCGAILHDVGKIREYSPGIAISQTMEGAFIGHSVIGDRLLRKAIENVRSSSGFSEELENELCHIVLSHHGTPDRGSPMKPKNVEGWVLHYADLMDSQVKDFMQKNVLTSDESATV